jgi:hypothetical protein
MSILFAARVASADAQAEAVALFDQGIKDLKAGDYAKACKELAASNDKWPDSGTKGALALCYTQLGKVASAWQLWHELADIAPTPALRGDATKKADKLAARVPHYTVKLAGPTPGVIVTINGGKVDPSLGLPLPIDPGPVAAAAEADGYVPWASKDLAATEGQQLDIEVPVLDKKKVTHSARSKDSTDKPTLSGGAGKATFAAAELVPGKSIDGNFTRDDELDGYLITVRANMRLKLEVTHAGSKMGLDTQLFVYGPVGSSSISNSADTPLYADDDSGWGKLSKIASATFVDAGKYAVVVTTKGGKGRGNYRLVASCLAGCTNSSSIEQPEVPVDPSIAPARHRRHLIGATIGGVGVAAAIAGGVFGFQASAGWSDAKTTCGGAIDSCPPAQLATAQRQVDDARSAATRSTIAIGAGAAAIVTGVVLWLTAPKLEVAVTPTVGSGTVGVAISGSL